MLVVINFLQESGGVVELRIIAIGLLGGKVHKSVTKKAFFSDFLLLSSLFTVWIRNMDILQLSWRHGDMSVNKSPSYIRKWIKSTEEAGTPFVGQTLIGSDWQK